MRNIIFFLLVINSINISQNLTGYYPLEIGNMWEYWDPYDSVFLYRKTVIGDTTLPNEKDYRVIKGEYPHPSPPSMFFQRQENSIVYQFYSWADSERVRYDFSKTVGDTIWNDSSIEAISRITFDGYDYFYGKLLRHTDYYTESTSSSYYNIDRVVDSIGLILNQFEPGVVYYLRGALINGVQYGTITSVNEIKTVPGQYFLFQNYPNPFNSQTQIRFILSEQSNVVLKVFDVLGRLVNILINKEFPSGEHYVNFDANGLSAGVYIYVLDAGNNFISKKMIFLP